MPSDAQDLQVVLAAQEKRELSPDVSSQVIDEMKSSLIFQFNWAELLQAAPTAISCMGACFVASSSPNANIQLEPPKPKGFDHLRFGSVQANLVECGNMGRMAFIAAEKGMGTIQLTSKVINGKINDILATIGEPESAKKMLRPQLNTLKQGSTTCLEEAQKMDKEFEAWLLYVCEMHAACVQQENTTREAILSNEICVAAEQTRLDYQKSTVEEAQKAFNLMGKQVETASEAFKLASDKFPTGWDILGQQIVGDLVGAVTNLGNSFAHAFISNLNPIAKVEAGASIVGGFLNPKKDGSAAEDPAGGKQAAPAPVAPTAVPKNATDPAFAEVIRVDHLLSILQVIVSGKNTEGNIDWEQARNGGTGTDSKKNSIGYVKTMLEDAKTRFAQVATASEPSQTLSTIINVSLQVATGINDEVKKSSSASSEWPAKDSEKVKKWQEDFAVQYQKANTLISTAKTVPGVTANGIPLMTSEAERTAQISAKSAQAQAVLESAKNRLTTTQQMLTTAQENYVKSTDMLLEQKNKLGQIQATLTQLTKANVSLAEIKRVLIECIKLIINLKQQVTNLVRFFKAMEALVEMCIRFHVEPFLETVKMIVAADGTDPYKDLKIGNYTYTDFQRSQLYSAAVTMRAYFGVFGDIAKMWVQLSKDSIMPGLNMCDELSVTVDDKDGAAQMRKKIADLNKWATDAIDRVQKIAEEKQQEIMGGMESRIQEVAETTSQITPPPAATVKAITAGTEVTKQAAISHITEKAKSSPLSRFAIIDD
ncbi:hypothetical protein QBC45DRAFT_417155 [Copromyces sp. CBS 386.78]|nr:hypothetical protein QBC45DRAFT_417155 [Copromyces sp. CBS 386.78]